MNQSDEIEFYNRLKAALDAKRAGATGIKAVQLSAQSARLGVRIAEVSR